MASSGSFNVKNDNIHNFFFFAVLVANLNLPASLQNKNTRIGRFPWKRSVLQNPDREGTNQSAGICLRLGLPYNNIYYFNYLRSFSQMMQWVRKFQAISNKKVDTSCKIIIIAQCTVLSGCKTVLQSLGSKEEL